MILSGKPPEVHTITIFDVAKLDELMNFCVLLASSFN
jgi:hypothetical protein